MEIIDSFHCPCCDIQREQSHPRKYMRINGKLELICEACFSSQHTINNPNIWQEPEFVPMPELRLPYVFARMTSISCAHSKLRSIGSTMSICAFCNQVFTDY